MITIQELKSKVSTDLDFVFSYLLETENELKEDNTILVIYSQYLDYKKQRITGQFSSEEQAIYMARIRQRLMDWIDSAFNRKTLFVDNLPKSEWTKKEIKLKNIADVYMILSALSNVEKEFIEVFWRLRVHYLMIRNSIDQLRYLKIENLLIFLEEYEKEYSATDKSRVMMLRVIIDLSDRTDFSIHNNDLVRLSKLLHKFKGTIGKDIGMDRLDEQNVSIFKDFTAKKRNSILDYIYPRPYNERRFHLLKDMFENVKVVNNRYRELVVRFEGIRDLT